MFLDWFSWAQGIIHFGWVIEIKSTYIVFKIEPLFSNISNPIADIQWHVRMFCMATRTNEWVSERVSVFYSVLFVLCSGLCYTINDNHFAWFIYDKNISKIPIGCHFSWKFFGLVFSLYQRWLFIVCGLKFSTT